jgi:hypothetical protein
MSDGEETPDDEMGERAGGGRLRLWFVLEGDRRAVTGMFVAAVFSTLVLVGTYAPGAEAALRSGDSSDTLFQALLTATITGVTLVLTLNQLVLSQELGAVGDQRERMEAAAAFRSDVADVIGAAVTPAEPSAALRALVEHASERSAALAAASEELDDAVREELTALTDSVEANAASVSGDLQDAQFGEFDVLSAALDFNYSWKLFAAQRLRERHGDALSEDADDALAELTETLRLFGPAREHFKTLYFQWDLIDLSRGILATAVPALLVAATAIAFLDPATYRVTVAGRGTLILLVAAAVTVTLLPFLLLLAYVVRIATVAKRTLSIGPFILRDTDDVADVDWEG